MTVVRVTDVGYFADHDTAALRRIVTKYTGDSIIMLGNGAVELSVEALRISNNAWAELAIRGEL